MGRHMDHQDAYMRPLSAPKSGGKRTTSAKMRKRPRAQSGKAKQIRQYLSEQEAQHLAIMEANQAQTAIVQEENDITDD